MMISLGINILFAIVIYKGILIFIDILDRYNHYNPEWRDDD